MGPFSLKVNVLVYSRASTQRSSVFRALSKHAAAQLCVLFLKQFNQLSVSYPEGVYREGGDAEMKSAYMETYSVVRFSWSLDSFRG